MLAVYSGTVNGIKQEWAVECKSYHIEDILAFGDEQIGIKFHLSPVSLQLSLYNDSHHPELEPAYQGTIIKELSIYNDNHVEIYSYSSSPRVPYTYSPAFLARGEAGNKKLKKGIMGTTDIDVPKPVTKGREGDSHCECDNCVYTRRHGGYMVCKKAVGVGHGWLPSDGLQ